MKLLKTIFVIVVIGGISALIYRFRVELGLEAENKVSTNEFTAEKALAASLALNDELDKRISSLTADLQVVQNSNTINALAGENLALGRIVILNNGKAYLYDITNPSHANLPVGITKTIGNTNDLVTIILSGRVLLTQSLVPNSRYYVGAGGTTTAVVPTSNLLQSVGIAVSEHELILDFSQKINL